MSETEIIEESMEEMEANRKRAIHAVMSFALGLAILVLVALVIVVLIKTKPKAVREDPKPLLPVVDVWIATAKARQAEIVSQGVVNSVREVSLSAEVSGRVVAVAPGLLRGAVVGAGDVLVEIEPADYLAELARAESVLAEAKLAHAQEVARKEQAVRDWKDLGRGKPSDLMLRIPQTAAAEARVDSAMAEVARAARNVERTRITAPFDGTVRMKSVELGAVLAPGSMVVQIYSTNELEVRLPLTLNDFGFLQRLEDGSVEGEVELTGTLGTDECRWPGRVVRVDGEVDRETLSATVIVRVGEAELGPSYLRRPPVGLFVEAVVPGRKLDALVKIPRTAIRGGNEVIVVGEDQRLSIRTVRVARGDRQFIYISDGVADGEPVVTTRMSGVANGVEVRIQTRDGEEITEVAEEQTP